MKFDNESFELITEMAHLVQLSFKVLDSIDPVITNGVISFVNHDLVSSGMRKLKDDAFELVQ
jgi:hypothetical protein